MKIGMILDEVFPPDVRVENEASILVKNGHEVYLLSINNSSGSNESYKGVFVKRHKISKFLFKLSALAYSIPVYHLYLKGEIKAFIRDYEIEAIHIHDIRIARSLFMIKNKNIPVILDLHENRPEIMKSYSWVNTIAGKILVYPKRWKKYEKKYLRKSDKVIVVTEEAKVYYQKNYGINPQKFVILPNTVRKEFYEDYSIDNKISIKFKNNFVLLYLGDTGLRRGLLTVIKSLKELSKKIKNIKLVIVGSSKDDIILKKTVSKLNLENFVSFEGWQHFSSFQSYINCCDIGISPIHRNIHHDTTYANKIFQYMALEKPILISDCPPQRDLVEKYNCGMVFEAENYKNFSEKVINLFENTQLAEEFGKNGKDAIKKELNWEEQSKNLIKFYKHLNNDNKKFRGEVS